MAQPTAAQAVKSFADFLASEYELAVQDADGELFRSAWTFEELADEWLKRDHSQWVPGDPLP